MTLAVAYAREITAAAARHQLDPRLLAAVAAQETGGPQSNSGRNIVGDGGHGRGVFQIDDRYHAFARTLEAMDPAKNADYAATMISGLLRRYGGNVHRALSAYNAGSPDTAGTKTAWQDGSLLGYADSVLRHYRNLGADGPAAALAADVRAESLHEQAATSALSSFASSRLSSSPPPPTLDAPCSYRALAGLDDLGNARQTNPYAGLIEPDQTDAPTGELDGF